MELLVIIVLIYAVHRAVEDSKSALRKSRDAYGKSADLRFPKAGKSRRAVHAARHDSGFWIGQAAQGFPAARHGLAAGWHAGRKAQAEGRAAREEAKAEHLEARVRLIPEVRRHLERQRAALEQIRAEREVQAAQAGGEEGSPQPVMAPPPRPAAVAAAPASAAPGKSAASPGEGREVPGEGSAGEQEPPAARDEAPPSATAAEGDGRTYSYGAADVPHAWPAGGAAEAHAQARYMSEAGSPWVVTEYPPGGGSGTTAATYLGGEEIQPTAAQVSAWEARAGERREQYARLEQEAGCPAPPQSPQPEGEPTVPAAADTTYDGVLTLMTQARADAETNAAVQQQLSRNAEAMSDQMQALDVDAGTLSAMADHLDAQQAAVKAQERVQETAETVEAQLKRGHQGLKEARDNAPVEAADKAFYVG